MVRGRAFIALSALIEGCTCGSRAPSGAADAGAATTEGPRAAAAATGDEGAFGAPIAGARSVAGDVVAGLVPSRGVVRILGGIGAAPGWSSDALRDVAWAPDADLRLQATPSGFALVWRGPRGGKSGRTLVLLGPHGEPTQPPVEIGAAFCATASGVAWIEPRASGAARVLARAWSEAAARPVTSVPPDRDPALVCGDHDVFVLGDGDDDLTVGSFTPGDASARASVVAVRDSDFGDDEEREHEVYAVGDDLGIVRVGASGAVAVREIPRGAPAAPWRRLKHAIPADDDVVAADGDADSTVLVFTHDSDAACPGVGASAESVRALRVGRLTGAEAVLELAAPSCDRTLGPFWIAQAPASTAVGWIERGSARPAAGGAPVAGAALRLLRSEGVVTRWIAQPAEVLVDSGCDARACALAALVASAASPGLEAGPRTGSLRVVPYP